MKIDQGMLEQLGSALNGPGLSAKESGDGNFAALLVKALTGESEALLEGEGLLEEGEVQKEIEAALELFTEAGEMKDEVEEGMLMQALVSFLKSDPDAKPGNQLKQTEFTGKADVEKVPVDSKDAIGLAAQKAAAEVGFEGEAEKGKIQLDGEKTVLKMDAETGEKLAKATALQGEQALSKEPVEKGGSKTVSGEESAKAKGDTLNVEADLKGKVSATSAEKAAENASARQPEKADALKVEADLKGKLNVAPADNQKSKETGTVRLADQLNTAASEKTEAPQGGAEKEAAIITGKADAGRVETNAPKPQNVTAAAEQNTLFQQPSVRGDEALQSSRVLNAQPSAQVRESVIQQIEGRMVYLRESGINPAEMRVTLHPPELGEVTVRVFSRQGRLSASIIAESPLVKEILESSISELRQRMNFVSIQFEQLDVSTAQKDFDGSGWPGEGHNAEDFNPGNAGGGKDGDEEGDPLIHHKLPDSGGIDFWA